MGSGDGKLPLRKESAKTWIIALSLLAITVIAYIPALSAGFIWDDDYYVYRNFALRSADGLWRIWTHPGEVPQYYPLTHTTFWIEYHLWGNAATGYHIVNVLLHATSAFLLWRILTALQVPGSLFAAALFAVHPVHVESVAWITERKNVLSALFYLGSFAVLWRALGQPEEGKEPKLNLKLYALSLLLFLFALWSKTITSTLPAAVLLVLWLKRGRVRWQDVALVAPMFVLGALFGSITSWMEKNVVGAFGPEWDLSPLERVLIAGRAVWFYAGKLLWPNDLTFIYPKWQVDVQSPAQWAFPLAAAALVLVLLILRKRIGRGPLVAVLFFGGTLMPALGFFNIFPMLYSYVADHFQYLASIGVLTLVAAIIWRHVPRIPAMAASTVVVLILMVLTFRQSFAYKDQKALWTDTLRKNPNAWMASSNLGGIHLEEATGLVPDKQQGHIKLAKDLLEQSLAVRPNNPTAMVNLGWALHQLGEEQKAVGLWNDVMAMEGRVSPRLWPIVASNAQFQLGRHYHVSGELETAQKHYEKALEISPGHVNATTQLAALLTSRGDLQTAWQLLQGALKADPDSYTTWTNLGNLLMQAGESAEALDAYEKAVAIKPDHVPARYGAAIARASAGQLAAAETDLRALVAERPDLPDALASLGTVLAKTGRAGEARQYLERALQIQPDHAAARRQLEQLGQ